MLQHLLLLLLGYFHGGKLEGVTVGAEAVAGNLGTGQVLLMPCVLNVAGCCPHCAGVCHCGFVPPDIRD